MHIVNIKTIYIYISYFYRAGSKCEYLYTLCVQCAQVFTPMQIDNSAQLVTIKVNTLCIVLHQQATQQQHMLLFCHQDLYQQLQYLTQIQVISQYGLHAYIIQ